MTHTSIRHYSLITSAYWAFTLTDGALRMLVLLYFHQLGYTPLEIASLFLFYEFFGVVTNLLGGWIGAHSGLRSTLLAGLLLQVIALCMLALLDPGWSTVVAVAYVMAAQAISGIAKDLTKMSAKSAIKLVVTDTAQGLLFKWVAILTGSKNALKGAGFFLGGVLLASLGYQTSLYSMAVVLTIVLFTSLLFIPTDLGKASAKVRFHHLWSKSHSINILSTARFFLFGSRDIWFVVALPLFMSSELGWSHPQVGGYLAAWIIGYGIVQSLAPAVMRKRVPDGQTALQWVSILMLSPLCILLALASDWSAAWTLTVGLAIYGVLFAMNSAVHSYLILSYSTTDKVTMDVGFYYMANAAGRLAGTILSGLVYQSYGLAGCLWGATLFLLVSVLTSTRLPHDKS